MRRWWSGLSQETVNLSPLGFVGSNPTRRTRQKIPSVRDFLIRVRAGEMFCSSKTLEAGSWNFVSDGEQNIPDHKKIQEGALPRVRFQPGAQNNRESDFLMYAGWIRKPQAAKPCEAGGRGGVESSYERSELETRDRIQPGAH